MNEADKKYNVVDTTTTRLGRFLIRLDTVKEAGKEYPYSYIEQKDSVGVLAFDGDNIILIRQYRHSIEKYELEIPGGGIEIGETPESVAIRELIEETGYAVDSMERLGSYYPSPGSSDEVCYLFAASCHKAKEPNREPLEYMSVEMLPKHKFDEIIMNGQFKHSMGLVAWLMYKMRNE